jgi:endonuclease YncB( thermonuclease family)
VLPSLLLAVFLAAPQPVPFHVTESFSARVVGVADGDTITVLRDAHAQIRIRLEGIDCPERGQAFGSRAKEFTSGLVFRREVSVYGKEHDRLRSPRRKGIR